jgi:hypothetical protein
MKCKAEVQQLHHFWGEYHATIIAVFASEEQASAALADSRFAGWKRCTKGRDAARAIGIFGTGHELLPVEAMLETLGADRDKLGSLRYSVECGEVTEIEFEAIDARQLTLCA